MRTRVNLLAILLIVCYVIQVLEGAKSGQKRTQHKEHSISKKVLKEAQNKIATQSLISLRGDDKTEVLRTQTKNNALLPKDSYGGGRPRRRKRKMDRTMMALLMAYKMKFVALIPTMVGGLILLKATALLAGFFFALFAAVLGLKIR